jgi:DHA1 family tetracycline resistance protein-like MFS transporter
MNRRATLGTIFLTVFLDLLGFGLVVPYLPGVARGLGASSFVATLLGASYSLMQLVFVPFWGQLSDRTGRRPVLLASVGASAVGFLLLANASSLWMLFAARIWNGIATSNLAVAQAYIADVTEPRDRAKGMGLIGAGIGMGFVFGPVVGGLLEAVSPLSRGALPAYVGFGLALLNFALAVWRLPESRSPERRGEGVRRSPIDPERYRAALRFPGTGVALAVNFVLVLSFSSMEQTFRLFTEDAFHMDERATGLVLGFVGVILIAVQGGLIRPLSRAFSERGLVVTGVLLEAAGFLALSQSPRAGTLAALYAAVGVIALGSALANPSLSAYMSRCADAASQGVVLGVLQSAGALARVCGPAVGGALYQAVDDRAPYLASAGGMALAAALALRLRRPERTGAASARLAPP